VEARSSGSGEGDGASRRSQRTLTIGLGLGHWWITGGYGEPRFSSPSPHLLFIALRDRGPSAMRTAGPPDQGMDQGPNWPLGQLGGDQPNTLVWLFFLVSFQNIKAPTLFDSVQF